MRISSRPEATWPGQQGFLLAGLLPLLLLLLSSLAASWAVLWRSQARVALQSRLDVCAVKLATERERTLERLTRLNTPLRFTVKAIYAARGVQALGPVGFVLGKEAETIFLATNRTLARAENAQVAWGAAREASRLRCPPDAYSGEAAGCRASPALPAALTREKTLFPDLEGALVAVAGTSGELATIQCRTENGLATVLAIQGDAALARQGFTDVYRK